MFRKTLALALVALLAFAGYWFFWRTGDVVAVVNGESIARKDLNSRVGQITAEYERYGIEVTRDMLAEIRADTLDGMIEETLLVQAALAAGIVVTEAELEEYYLEVAADYGGEAALVALIIENGYTAETFKAAVAEGLTIERFQEQYIAENVDAELLAVTAAELQERYDFHAEQYYDMPPLEEIATYLEQELRAEKLDALLIIENLITELREKADIKIHSR